MKIDQELQSIMHPQHYYIMRSPATGVEEALWIVQIYFDIGGRR